MLAQEIQKRIEADANGANLNSFGWNFRSHLLQEPKLYDLKDHAGNPYEVWVVLQQPNDGYQIVFDPEILEFGLATGGVVIGTYGSFMDALNAM
jgi:hypothetical protein